MFNFKKMLGLTFIILGMVSNPAVTERAYGDDFPNKPIEFIVVYAAGGTTDIYMRTLCKIAAEDLGQAIVVLNKTGSGGAIGVQYLAKAKPDGYTAGCFALTAMETQPHFVKLYDPLKDIIPLMQVCEGPQGICVKVDSPFKTFKDLINYARENPGKVTYGTTGFGSVQHLTMERIATEAGIKWTNIPYKGGAAVIPSLLGGHITASGGVAEFVPHVKAGELRLLVVFNPKRLSEFPEARTLLEEGFHVSLSNYMGIGVPAGTARDRIEKLHKTFKRAMENPVFLKIMKEMSYEITYKPGDEFAEAIKNGYKLHGEILKKLGLTKQ